MNGRTRAAVLAAATLAMAAAPVALGQEWSLGVDRAVNIGGEAWTGPDGAVVQFTPPFSSGTALISLLVNGVSRGSSGYFGFSGQGQWHFASLQDGAYTARVRLESTHVCRGWMCNWQTSTRNTTFRVDRTPPSPPSLGTDPSGPRTSSDPIEWWPSTDWGAGVAAYELSVDGVQRARIEPGACTHVCQATLEPSLLPDGPHAVSVRATDGVGNASDSGQVALTISDTPTVELVSPPKFVIAGRTATVTARGATPNHSPLTYAWDTDGNGSFETDTGDSPTVRISPKADITLAVQVTAAGGQQATASAPIDVRKTPPSDEPGVTINDGDRFTREAEVTLSMSWPDGATGMRIATDGSFKGATTVPVAPTATITLKADDNALLPHVVYVRFQGAGIDARETYTDDIILDTTPPVIQQVAATPISAKAVRVTTRVRDAVSGPKRLQVARSVSVQGTTVAYAPTVRAAVKGSKVAVRVADAAGNWSRWKTVAARER